MVGVIEQMPGEGSVAAFERPDGGIGVRNLVLVLGINGLALRAAERISRLLAGTICVATSTGRGHVGEDYRVQLDHYVGFGRNPNIAAVLVVGADRATSAEVAQRIAASGKPVETVTLAEAGEDSIRLIDMGVRRGARLVRKASEARRTPCPVSGLVIGVECGHSDATSGIASNPVVGAAVDRLVAAGATVILGETVEWLGAEQLLARRGRDAEVSAAILAAVERRETFASRSGVSLTGHNPGEENIKGGLSTIEEKALGAIAKSGTQPIEGVLAVGEAPAGRGLYLMDGPYFSPESMTGFTAAGAQILLFTTGLGNSCVSSLAPTIKLSARGTTVAALSEQIDFDASPAWEGAQSTAAVGERLVEEIIAVGSGRLTWGEILGEGVEVVARMGASL
jgi:altronate dehydratase large subunit